VYDFKRPLYSENSYGDWFDGETGQSAFKNRSYNIMVHQDPHQHINRKIAGNINTDKILFAIFYLAGIAVKIQYQAAHTARNNNDLLIIDELKAISCTLKKAAQTFNVPIGK
jgi:hypothetical protein